MAKKEKELITITDQEYQKSLLKMTGSERLQKCFELSEWSAKVNKYYRTELEKRMNNYYILR